MGLNKTKLDVIYHTDLEVPELILSGCMRMNVESLEDIVISDTPGSVTLIQTSYYMNAFREIKENREVVIYMVGYLAPISEVVEDKDKYGLFFPEQFMEDSESDLMAVYQTPSGKTRVLENTKSVRVFATTEELMDAVVEFTRDFLEKIKGIAVEESEIQKLKVKKIETLDREKIVDNKK